MSCLVCNLMDGITALQRVGTGEFKEFASHGSRQMDMHTHRALSMSAWLVARGNNAAASLA